jgi:hypothetical protein
MLPAYIEDFVRECLADNRLAVLSLEAGHAIALEEVIHLASEAQALHMTIALQCRNLEAIKQYRMLWCTLEQFFDAVIGIWANAPQEGELLASHRHLLEHLRATARDQVEFYTITSGDRAGYRIRSVGDTKLLRGLRSKNIIRFGGNATRRKGVLKRRIDCNLPETIGGWGKPREGTADIRMHVPG